MKTFMMSIIGLIMVFTGCAWSADDYPYRNDYCPECVKNPCGYDPWGFAKKNCTSYVAWRMNKDCGYAMCFTNGMDGGHWGYAHNWDDNATDLGFQVNATPAVGAIAHWNAFEIDGDGGSGHVAYVEKVNADGTVNISEYNFNKCAYGERKTKARRYIHITRDCSDKVKGVAPPYDKFNLSDVSETEKLFLGFNSSGEGRDLNGDGRFSYADVVSAVYCQICRWDWRECNSGSTQSASNTLNNGFTAAMTLTNPELINPLNHRETKQLLSPSLESSLPETDKNPNDADYTLNASETNPIQSEVGNPFYLVDPSWCYYSCSQGWCSIAVPLGIYGASTEQNRQINAVSLRFSNLSTFASYCEIVPWLDGWNVNVGEMVNGVLKAVHVDSSIPLMHNEDDLFYLQCDLWYGLDLSDVVIKVSPEATVIGNNITYELPVHAIVENKILWSRQNDGLTSLWTMDSNDNFSSEKLYGPFTGWAVRSYNQSTDGTARILWQRQSDGLVSLWTVDTAGSFMSERLYGPFNGWLAKHYHKDEDGTGHILWQRTADGLVSLWTMDNNNKFTGERLYGPFAGWAVKSFHKNLDGTGRILWQRTADGLVSLWTIDANSKFTSEKLYGPFSGWSVVSYDENSTSGRLLWQRQSDKLVSLWTLDSGDKFTGEKLFGPFSGWSVQDYD